MEPKASTSAITPRVQTNIKKCFKIDDILLDNLSISYNESTCIFIFWNQYQIYVFEDLQFEESVRIFTPEFPIYQILDSNNYLVCLDCSENVHVTSLKFKSAAQKRFKSSYQPRESAVLYCQLFNQDYTISLKMELGGYALWIHKIGTDLFMYRKFSIKHEKDYLPTKSEANYLMRCYPLKEIDYCYIVNKFQPNPGHKYKDHKLVLISFDKINIYGCLISLNTTETEVQLVKLYSSPAEICDFTIMDNTLDILIGLTMGTVIKISMKSASNITDIVHLNTAISKFIPSKTNDSFIYTDGLTLWMITKAFTKEDRKFLQFFPKNIKDFVKFRDQIIAISFSNIIYIIPIEDASSYVNQSSIEYCPAKKLFENANYIENVVKETQKSKEFIAKIRNETNYITALTFSRRQEVMKGLIQETVVLYDNYDDAIRDNPATKLTEEISEYFKTNMLLHIKIVLKAEFHIYTQVLSEIFCNLRIHITISSQNKIISTTSIKPTEPLKILQFLLPIPSKHTVNLTQMNIDIKIISSIPAIRDESKKLWTIVYQNLTILHSEHFIKKPKDSTIKPDIICLKQPSESLQTYIHRTACVQHGHIFKFIDLTANATKQSYTMYINLPLDFTEAFSCEEFYKKHFESDRAKFMLKLFNTDTFLHGRTYLYLEIANEKVKIKIDKELFCSVLKITCSNIHVAFTMRNFIANLIYYKDLQHIASRKMFVSNAFYTTAETMKTAIQDAIATRADADLPTLMEQFQKNILAVLPL